MSQTLSVHKFLDRLKQRSCFVEGQRVVRDKDVAELYGVPIGQLRRAVRRHSACFPPDLVFKTSEEEYVFTEEGILLVSSVLKNSQAVQISIEIIRELHSFRAN